MAEHGCCLVVIWRLPLFKLTGVDPFLYLSKNNTKQREVSVSVSVPDLMLLYKEPCPCWQFARIPDQPHVSCSANNLTTPFLCVYSYYAIVDQVRLRQLPKMPEVLPGKEPSAGLHALLNQTPIGQFGPVSSRTAAHCCRCQLELSGPLGLYKILKNI